MVVAYVFFGLLVTLTVVAFVVAIVAGARSWLFTKLWDNRVNDPWSRPWFTWYD